MVKIAFLAVMIGNGYTPVLRYVTGTVWAISVVALVALALNRPYSLLDLWLIVVMVALTWRTATQTYTETSGSRTWLELCGFFCRRRWCSRPIPFCYAELASKSLAYGVSSPRLWGTPDCSTSGSPVS